MPKRPFAEAEATAAGLALLERGIADAAIYAEAVAAVTGCIASLRRPASAPSDGEAEARGEAYRRFRRELAWLAARERRSDGAGPIARLLAAVSQAEEPLESEEYPSLDAARSLLALLDPGAEALR
jgi:hypothetical protein